MKPTGISDPTIHLSACHVSSPRNQELAQLELLCKQLYEATSAEDRMKAEAAVVLLSNSPDCLPKCQLLLERGDVSPFSFNFNPKLNVSIKY